MFACLSATLGKCSLIKKEDSGEIYLKDQSLQVPDYRIALDSGHEFLVEVKNYYQDDPDAPYSFSVPYLDGLRNYAILAKRELKLAIYWVEWNIWSLVPENKIKKEGDLYLISMIDAFQANEMYLLGDYQIGTRMPLKMKLVADKNKPRTVGANGDCRFTIGGVELYCGSTRIEDDLEKKIAFFFMLFGQWQHENPVADIVNDELKSIDFIFDPPEKTPEQEFEILGPVSSMFALHYKMVTAPDDDIEKISPKEDLASIVYNIPRDYKGKYLPLWRFTVLPKDKKERANK